jgi:hypothetical protein
VNGVDTISRAASAELPLNVGANTITVEVTAQDGITHKTNTIIVTRLSGNQSSSNPSTSSSSPAPSKGVKVIVDGIVQEQLATLKQDSIAGQTATIITVDNDKVLAKLEKDGMKVLTIFGAGNSDVVVSELNGELVKAVEGKNTVIEIKTDRGTYTLPASQINIDSISAGLGSHVKLEDIKVSIKIGLSLQTTAAAIQKSASDGAMLLVGSPVDFEVTATWDGTTIAVINSLTNSSYALVQSPKTFADVENHWSKQDVNDMASRLIVQGVTKEAFQPDKAIGVVHRWSQSSGLGEEWSSSSGKKQYCSRR